VSAGTPGRERSAHGPLIALLIAGLADKETASSSLQRGPFRRQSAPARGGRQARTAVQRSRRARGLGSAPRNCAAALERLLRRARATWPRAEPAHRHQLAHRRARALAHQVSGGAPVAHRARARSAPPAERGPPLKCPTRERLRPREPAAASGAEGSCPRVSLGHASQRAHGQARDARTGRLSAARRGGERYAPALLLRGQEQ
jgi:hypothetical protein